MPHPSGNSKFFKCFGLREPPPPRKSQSLLWQGYGYFLELHIVMACHLGYVLFLLWEICRWGQQKVKKVNLICLATWGSSLYFYRTGHLPLTVLKRFSTSGLSLYLLTVSGLLFQPLSCYRHSQRWGESIILLAQVQRNVINLGTKS